MLQDRTEDKGKDLIEDQQDDMTLDSPAVGGAIWQEQRRRQGKEESCLNRLQLQAQRHDDLSVQHRAYDPETTAPSVSGSEDSTSTYPNEISADAGGELTIHIGEPESHAPAGGDNEFMHSQAPMRMDGTTPIVYLTLTFDTPLPIPNLSDQSGTNGQNRAIASDHPRLLSSPDLTRFTDPFFWPASRKRLLLTLSCFATFITAYAAGSYSPPAQIMADDLGTSKLVTLGGITTFCFGFGLAPMLLAPLSELYGRYPVCVAAGVVFVISQIACSFMPNATGMLIGRLMVGTGGSVYSSVVGGVIADIYQKEERNTPMAIFSGAVLVGTGVGPLIASIMVERIGKIDDTLAWKWIFWHQVVSGSILVAALAFFWHESRACVLLAGKAKALNKWYDAREKAGFFGMWVDESSAGDNDTLIESDSTPRIGYLGGGGRNMDVEKSHIHPPEPGRPMGSRVLNLQRIRWVVAEHEQRASLTKMITISASRPFYLLFTEPVVFFFSLWCAFAWAILYLTFGSVPLVLQTVYGMDTEQSGYVFVAMIVGSLLATITGIWQDKLLEHPQWRGRMVGDDTPYKPSAFWSFMRRRFPPESPEARLYFTCFVSLLLPAGLFIFGLTSRPDYHWIGPAIGVASGTWGILTIYLATFNYFADIYHKYASSALAAQSFCRNILGGAFPLVTGILFTNLGPARAGGLLGGIAMALTVVPWVLVLNGEKIRSRSNFAIVSTTLWDGDKHQKSCHVFIFIFLFFLANQELSGTEPRKGLRNEE
jgi:MFS family permease